MYFTPCDLNKHLLSLTMLELGHYYHHHHHHYLQGSLHLKLRASCCVAILTLKPKLGLVMLNSLELATRSQRTPGTNTVLPRHECLAWFQVAFRYVGVAQYSVEFIKNATASTRDDRICLVSSYFLL